MAEWRPVVGWESLYEVSELGEIHRFGSKRLTRGQRDRKGYQRIVFWNFRPLQRTSIHRVVAEAFLGMPPTPLHQVNHIDGNKQNNVVSNLEWVTQSGNMAHAYRLGLKALMSGEKNGRAKLTREQAEEIRVSPLPGHAAAAAYGVTHQNITRIRRGQTWRGVA